MVWHKNPISFFYMCISSFPNTIYWWDDPFPVLCSWHHCQKTGWPQMCGFIPGILYSVPLAYPSVFMPVPYCLDYHGFEIYFEIRKCDSSSFVIISQDCFGYSGYFVVEYEFWGFFSTATKNAIGIIMGIALNP